MTMPTHCPTSYPHIREISLIAHQATMPPLGARPSTDRPIGIASVVLIIENPAHAEGSLTLQAVEVVSVETQEVMFSQTHPQSITLMPLEHRHIDSQLINQIGYPNTDKVMAIATYQLAKGKSTAEYTITSPVTRVERSPC